MPRRPCFIASRSLATSVALRKSLARSWVSVASLVGVGGLNTFNISPLGRGRWTHWDSVRNQPNVANQPSRRGDGGQPNDPRLMAERVETRGEQRHQRRLVGVAEVRVMPANDEVEFIAHGVVAVCDGKMECRRAGHENQRNPIFHGRSKPRRFCEIEPGHLHHRACKRTHRRVHARAASTVPLVLRVGLRLRLQRFLHRYACHRVPRGRHTFTTRLGDKAISRIECLSPNGGVDAEFGKSRIASQGLKMRQY